MTNDFSILVERMKRAAHAANDSALARLLGVTPQALSNYKKRGTMPYTQIFKFAQLTGTSLDALTADGGVAVNTEGI